MPNNLIQIVMDSCRYDTAVAAHTPNMDRIGKLQRRWSYASWTAPSHYALLMGLMPHQSPPGVFASEVYKQEFGGWMERLDMPDLSIKTFLPQLSLPKVLQGLGYHCSARVSMPVLNAFTLLNQFFDDYRLMSNHNDFAGMLDDIVFPDSQPRYYLLNLGETHYPYMLQDEDLPIISGVHGVLKHAGDESTEAHREPTAFFKEPEMRRLHQQQIRCVEYVDQRLGELIEKCPPNTYFVVTSDHGELFGEGGYFGHGPIMHEKVFEVPFLEGLRP
jgi:hypothetical protein